MIEKEYVYYDIIYDWIFVTDQNHHNLFGKYLTPIQLIYIGEL